MNLEKISGAEIAPQWSHCHVHRVDPFQAMFWCNFAKRYCFLPKKVGNGTYFGERRSCIGAPDELLWLLWGTIFIKQFLSGAKIVPRPLWKVRYCFHCTLRKKCWNDVDFLHTLRFSYFLHRTEVDNSPHNNRHLTDNVDYPPQRKILIMKSFFYVESTPRKKMIDCMWNIQRMSFYVENLHLYNDFFGRVWFHCWSGGTIFNLFFLLEKLLHCGAKIVPLFQKRYVFQLFLLEKGCTVELFWQIVRPSLVNSLVRGNFFSHFFSEKLYGLHFFQCGDFSTCFL